MCVIINHLLIKFLVMKIVLILYTCILGCVTKSNPPPFKTVQFGKKKNLELFVRVGDPSCPFYEQQSDPQIALFQDQNGNWTIGQNKNIHSSANKVLLA